MLLEQVIRTDIGEFDASSRSFHVSNFGTLLEAVRGGIAGSVRGVTRFHVRK